MGRYGMGGQIGFVHWGFPVNKRELGVLRGSYMFKKKTRTLTEGCFLSRRFDQTVVLVYFGCYNYDSKL